MTVKLTIGTFSVEVSGEAEYVDKKFEELVTRFLSSRTPAVVDQSSSVVEASATGKMMSPAEFLRKTTAKNQFDRALVFGYYLEKFRGISAFTSGELGQMGTDTKYPFANPSDAIAKLTGRGLMMSAGDKEGKRAHALTASGDAYVEGLLDDKS